MSGERREGREGRGERREADQERQTKRKYIDDILQDNHLEGEWTRVNESHQKSTKVKDSQRRVCDQSTLKCLVYDPV